LRLDKTDSTVDTPPPPGSPSASRTVRVLVVDDHEVVRIGLRQLIDTHEDLEVCGEATSVAEARTAIEMLRPDLVLLDLTLGPESGFDLLRALDGVAPAPRVLVLSIHDEALFADDSLSLGARGYTMKDSPPADLIAAIRRVAAGGIYLSDRLAQRVLRRLASGEVPRASEALTLREQEVIDLLAGALSTREIASRMGTALKTVDSHKRNICEKLGLDSAAALLRYAIINGRQSRAR
jgi:DNA-binding NarL/FixJ family response regulator